MNVIGTIFNTIDIFSKHIFSSTDSFGRFYSLSSTLILSPCFLADLILALIPLVFLKIINNLYFSPLQFHLFFRFNSYSFSFTSFTYLLFVSPSLCLSFSFSLSLAVAFILFILSLILEKVYSQSIALEAFPFI